MLSKITIQVEQETDDVSANVGYSDEQYFILRERSEYVGQEFCYVYRRNCGGHQYSRLSGPLVGLAPGIALIERLKKEDAARS